jgi:hypothetical protein
MKPTQLFHSRDRTAQRASRLRAKVVPWTVAQLAALVLGMALLTGSASASQSRVLTASFGGASSTPVDPYPLSNTSHCQDGNHVACRKRIAVDTTLGRPSSGDVYVGDPNNHRVEKFSPSGSFILMFGKDVDKTKVEEAGSTEAERDVCTAASGDTCQQGAEGTGPGAFVGKLLAVAVDGSSGSSAGDVYVANTTKTHVDKKGEGAGEGVVTKFDENGEVISSWGVGGQMQGSGQPFGSFGGITVDAAGNLWISGATEEEEGSGGSVRVLETPLVFELDEAGSLVTSWQPSEHAGQSSEIAVDGEHNVYLSVGILIDKFQQSDGKLVNEVAVGESGSFASNLSAHTIDVVKNPPRGGPGEIAGFETTCVKPRLQRCSPIEVFKPSRAHQLASLAVNYSIPTDTMYVGEVGKGDEQSEESEIAAEAIATVPGVRSLPAAPVSTSAATLNGTVDPEGVEIAQCFFEWGESGKPYEHVAHCASPGASEIVTKSGAVPVHAQIAIQPKTSYHFRLVAANANDLPEPVQGADVLLGPPRVDSTSVVEVTANSVTLQAEVNPQNLLATYHLEYLTEAEFNENGESFSGPRPATSVPLPDAELGSGQEDVAVSRHLRGLLTHTVYRYRVVAQNTLGEGADVVAGPAETFVTWGTGEFGLPDGRQWEMVSPPDKHGALVEPIAEPWLIQAAAGGGRMAYVTLAPSESNPAGYGLYQSNLATRGAGGGWTSRNLALPHITPTGISGGQGNEYRFFSEDLASTVVQPFGPFIACKSEEGAAQPCLSETASEQTAFLASDYAGAASSEPCSGSCYTPLVTGAEGYANVPPETVFGQTDMRGVKCPPALFCGPTFLDATPDASHVLLQSRVALTASSSTKASPPPNSFYEWSAGRPPGEQIRLVSVLPGNSAGEALPAAGPEFGFFNGSARHAISDDGARVVFRTKRTNLYLRENATEPQSPLGEHGECLVASDACTIQLDAGLTGVAQFQTANRAVTRIFFTEGKVSSGRAEGIDRDLYEYNVEKGELVRLTEGASMVASVIGAGEDGSRIYFVGNGAVAPGAAPGGLCIEAGESPPAVPQLSAGCNLYEMHYDGTAWETPKAVAVLSPYDVSDWSGDESGYHALAARVSPNGDWLAFTSVRRLTGYDNADRVSGEPDREVYEFNAATGRLVCASCNPTRSRPHGVFSAQADTGVGGISGGDSVYTTGWQAATVPGWTPALEFEASLYQSRYLSDSGRLFFNSSDALVPKDVNNTVDVYEYEPEGVPAGEHACSSASASGSVTFKPARNVQVDGRAVQEGAGCVGLISSGESPDESAFLDATETGSEVFYMTSAKLLPQDTDTAYDVYDARECAASSPCLPAPTPVPPPCDNEASCKPAPTPQPGVFAPSGSATFSGTGNLVAPLLAIVAAAPSKPLTKAQKLALALKACKKQRNRKQRAACEKHARKRYAGEAKPKARKAGAGRGRGR